MIIQTGMRTDIPAFYSEWFLNRMREGFVMVRNPYNPQMVTRYELSPEVVDLIAFCTKNPAPMLGHMDVLKPYGQYWFVTITPYGNEIEPQVPPKETVMEDFKRLSDAVGVDCVGWRYDPIFLSDTYPLERHLEDFERMAENLSGYTRTCVISFIDLYKKVEKNFPEARAVRKEERIQIGEAFARIGARYCMTIRSCAEGDELAPYGVDCSGCMTVETFETALHGHLNAPKKKSPRAECACFLGNDIGAYNTCAHFCRYCYANYDAATVRRNRQNHDPSSPLLIGHLHPDDKVHQAKQETWLDRQLTLWSLTP
jgi:hypothetical protein